MQASNQHNGYNHKLGQSFDEVFRLYNRQVLSYCMRHLSSVEDAEEIAQDVFVNLWKHFGEIKDRDRVLPYMLITARNLIINAYRRRIDSEIYADYVRYASSFVAEDSTSRPIEYREFEAMTIRAIATLPPTQGHVIMLSRFEGLDNKEIALRLNLSLQTVKNTLTQGLKELKNIMRKLPPTIFIFIYIKHCFPFMFNE